MSATYSRTAMTEEGYLPNPSAAVHIDALTQLLGIEPTDRRGQYYVRPFTELSSPALAYLRNRAVQTFPDLYAQDSTRAMSVTRACMRLAARPDASPDDGTGIDYRTRNRVLSGADTFALTTDEFDTLELLRAKLECEVLDGNAADPVANVLMQTAKHQPRNDGQIRTYRRAMFVTGGSEPSGTTSAERRALRLSGNGAALSTSEGTYALLRRANMMLKSSGESSTRPWKMAGAMEDQQKGENTEGAESRYAANGELRKACPAAHGKDHTHDTTKRGELRPIGVNPDSIGKIKRPQIRNYAQPQVIGSVATVVRQPVDMGYTSTQALVGGVWQEVVGTHPYRPYESTSVVLGYVLTYNGRRAIGHQWSDVASKDNVARPTTRAGRAKRTKDEPIEVDAPHAPAYARLKAMEAFAQVLNTEGLPTQETTRSAKSVKFSVDGAVFSVTKADGKAYRLAVQYPDGTRKTTTCTAPDHIATAVRNRIR